MSIPRIGCVLACALWLSGCGNDMASSPDMASPPLELTAFAKDLVENHTGEDNEPAEIAGKSFSDSEDPNPFAASFFG